MKRAPIQGLSALLYEPNGATVQLQPSPAAAELPSPAPEPQPSPTADVQSAAAAVEPISTPSHRRNAPTAAQRNARAAQRPKGPTADVQKGKPRSGSLVQPYERADGQLTVHVTFSLPLDLAKQLRIFCAGLEPGRRNEWAADCLRAGMGEGA